MSNGPLPPAEPDSAPWPSSSALSDGAAGRGDGSQPGPGPGAEVRAVVDSTVVGIEKPDAGIFDVALEIAGAQRGQVVHVGDMLGTDIAGAHAAGLVPIHLDPSRHCRTRDHRHVRALTGIWHHVAPAGD